MREDQASASREDYLANDQGPRFWERTLRAAKATGAESAAGGTVEQERRTLGCP